MAVKDKHDSGSQKSSLATQKKPPPPLPVRMLVSATMTGIGLISLLYLFNPGMGWIEIFPDNLPFIGNLDEAGATAMLLMVLSYWGFDVTRLGQRLGSWSKGIKALPAGDDSHKVGHDA